MPTVNKNIDFNFFSRSGRVPPKAALQKSKIIISRARVVLKELTELGITKNISGDVIIEGGSKKLIFKF